MKKLLAAVLVFGSLGCKSKESKPAEEAKVLARVGDVEITEEDLSAQLPDVPGIQLGEAERKDILDKLIMVSVFYQEAKAESLDTLPSVQRRVRWAERAVLADEFLRRRLSQVQVSDQDIENYIKEHQDEFETQVALLQVGLRDPSLADTIRVLLRDRSFAAQRMLEYFGQKGMILINPLGYINVAALPFNFPPDLARELQGAKAGDIVGPTQVGGLPSLIVVMERKRVKPNMDEIKPVLRQALLMERQAQLVDSLYGALRVKYLADTSGGKK